MPASSGLLSCTVNGSLKKGLWFSHLLPRPRSERSFSSGLPLVTAGYLGDSQSWSPVRGARCEPQSPLACMLMAVFCSLFSCSFRHPDA